ncbi:MAG TPA: FG-GAP-like repeat-containing protein [Ignavibacteria bacterium]|nr:FG-GAP-like repeat-containing protein [Ignavibacteria bacterium]
MRYFTKSFCLSLVILSNFICTDSLLSQFFVKVTEASNPVVNEPLAGTYIGASWIDVDNDELIDLYISRKDIFRNLGNGNFLKVTGSIPLQGPVLGSSWADYDNDGDPDLFVITTIQANPTSHLYRNDGNFVFTKMLSGSIADSNLNTGWGCVWGDINNDTYADLFLAAAYNFNGVLHENRLFYNNGNGTFTRIDSTQTTDSLDAFTIPMFSDYDQDGDADLFIGTGPANNIGGRDYLFRNLLKEQNVPYFLNRIDTGIIATDIVDGQNWNWIDIDNDGDLDGFLTNYSTNIKNRLYRCDGPHYYVKMTAAEVGTIVSDPGAWLGNNWGDFDNDGDLDCFITNDAGASRYYSNNGTGFFTRIDTLAIIVNGQTYGTTFGDYDNDGDLDIYMAGSNSTKGLFRNETNNNNKWVNIHCIGSGPAAGMTNKSGLGTIVKMKAVINGTPKWQTREINAQNSFNAMNSLNVHFGLHNASVIDSMIVKWGGGLTQVFTNVVPNKFYRLTEGQGLSEIVIGISQIGSQIPNSFRLDQNYPNPFNPVTKIRFSIPKFSGVNLSVYDVTGRLVSELVNSELNAGEYETDFNAHNITSGVYFYTLRAGSFNDTKKLIVIK